MYEYDTYHIGSTVLILYYSLRMLQHSLLADGGGHEPPMDAAGCGAAPEHLPREGPPAVHVRAVARRRLSPAGVAGRSCGGGRVVWLALIRRRVPRQELSGHLFSAALERLDANSCTSDVCGGVGLDRALGPGPGPGLRRSVRQRAGPPPAALLRPARPREEQEYLPVRLSPEAQLAQGGSRLHQHAHRTRPDQRHAGAFRALHSISIVQSEDSIEHLWCS